MEKIENRGTARGIFSSASGSQLTAREAGILRVCKCFQKSCTDWLPRHAASQSLKPKPCFFSSGDPDEQMFSVSRLVGMMPKSTRRCADMGAPHGTSQVLAVPAMRPGWDVLPFLHHPHAGAPSRRKPSGESQARPFCPEVGGGLETTRDRTLTHNLESRRLTVFDVSKKSHCSHLARQEELTANRPLLGYHYFHSCPKSTDRVKAEQSSRSFSSCQWLLVFWGRMMLKNPWGSTDEDRARACQSPMGLTAYFAFLSSTSNPKGGKKHLWSQRHRQGKESWNNADLSDLKRTISWTDFFYQSTEQQQRKLKGK